MNAILQDDLDLKNRMASAFQAFCKEVSSLRTGRASPTFLDGVMVAAYGSLVPLNQVGTINVAEALLLTVQVWDQKLVKFVEKAIRDSNLGLNPSADGNLIRVPLPAITQERRLELVKLAGKYSESARISIRNVRREGMDFIKKMEKDKKLSEDETRRLSDDIQDLTDSFIQKVDQLLATKEKEIMTI